MHRIQTLDEKSERLNEWVCKTFSALMTVFSVGIWAWGLGWALEMEGAHNLLFDMFAIILLRANTDYFWAISFDKHMRSHLTPEYKAFSGIFRSETRRFPK